MNAEGGRDAQSVALLTALGGYEKWLVEQERPGVPGTDSLVAQQELQKVLEIRRDSFAHLTQVASQLLLTHARISELLYERQLRALRGATTG